MEQKIRKKEKYLTKQDNTLKEEIKYSVEKRLVTKSIYILVPLLLMLFTYLFIASLCLE